MDQPKLDLKMLVVPACLLFSRQIDFKNPDILYMFRILFGTVSALIFSLYFYIYSRVKAKNDKKKVWVPPKPKPALPFGLGPPAEPVSHTDYEETTYVDYEVKLLKEAAQSLVMSVGISAVMSMQFNVHLSLLIQSISLPLALTDLPLVKKYVFGMSKKSDGTSFYGELYMKPTEESLKLANITLAAIAARNSSGEALPTMVGANEPRVEELNDEDEQETKAEVKVADQ